MRIDHIQLAMPAGGEEDARRFYGRLLEMAEVPKPDPVRSRGGCWFRSVEYEVHLGVDPDFRPQRKAHPAFSVEDLDALAERLEDAGFAVGWDDVLPGVRRFFTSDPFGNRVEFVAQGSGLRDVSLPVARACGALVDRGRVLMVRHSSLDGAYWTLPGGHVEPDETPERAAVREFREETGVDVEVSRVLWDELLPNGYGLESSSVGRCFLMEPSGSVDPTLGSDPEEEDLPIVGRVLQEVAWQSLEEMRYDPQVSRVIDALGTHARDS